MLILRSRTATGAVDLALPVRLAALGFSSFAGPERFCVDVIRFARRAESKIVDIMPVTLIVPDFGRTVLKVKGSRFDTFRALSLNNISVVRHMRQPSPQAAMLNWASNAAMREPHRVTWLSFQHWQKATRPSSGEGSAPLPMRWQ